MANNKLYGYTPKMSNEKDGNRLDRLNPYEFRKGMDYELTSIGCARLQESTPEEREMATEKVVKNLQENGGYYSSLIQYETEYRNKKDKPNFKTWLKEFSEEYKMKEVDQQFTYKNTQLGNSDKMTEPKYDKGEYTKPFKTDLLKEAIKEEVRNLIKEDEDKEEKTAVKKAKGSSKGIKALDKESEKLRDQKKKLQAKIRPLVQDFNAKKIDRAKYDKKIGDIPKQIKDINKRLGEIEEEKDDILLKEKEDRRAVASTAMDRDVHRKLLEIIKEKGISLREGSENIRVYYEIAKLAYMEGLTAGLQSDE